jgi:uncharacterized protein YjbI with pentapeptide repeats
MTTGYQNVTGTEDQPLTRSDVERLLREVGSSEKLNLSSRNLNGIDLLAFDLTGANLSNANLGGAILREAVLIRVNMRNADLRQADLVKANLRSADLRGANLFGASMGLADLTEADLSQANLTIVTLSRANLSGAILHDAILTQADLSRANLRGADLRGADLLTAYLGYSNLSEAQLAGAHLSEADKNQLHAMGIQISEEYSSGSSQEDHAIRIRIVEEPLTAYNLSLIISNLTELTTKLWLVSKGRFADLIEYVQTRNNEFGEEAHTIVSSITYNSPINIDWKVDTSAPSSQSRLLLTTG